VVAVTWFMVDDAFHSHPKAHKAGHAAVGLWVIAGSYSAQNKLNGFVPAWFVLRSPNGKREAPRLVEAGLWEPAERDGEQGWRFHDWDHYQLSLEEIEARRERNRERQRRHRQRVARGDKTSESDA
jgi:hypothetical protein